MVTVDLPPVLAGWREAPRIRPLNGRAVATGGHYILCWLQQALRARDNPVIDAAIRLGNAMRLPVLVYHGVREDYPYASDRLHSFILGANRDLATGCRERGFAFACHVDRAGRREKGLVHRLGADAAAIVVEDTLTFVARWQANRVAARASVPVYAINAACLVPRALIGTDVRGRSSFLRQHEPERAAWIEAQDETPDVGRYEGSLPFGSDDLQGIDLDSLVASLAIDHTVPASAMYPAVRAAAEDRLSRLISDLLPGYASTRNDATQAEGASGLSPYLHFGVIGPREVMAQVAKVKAGAQHKRKFADELLGWREWFFFQASQLAAPERYDRVAGWARATLPAHAGDLRPDVETMDSIAARGDARRNLERVPAAISHRWVDAQQFAYVLGQADPRHDAEPGEGRGRRLAISTSGSASTAAIPAPTAISPRCSLARRRIASDRSTDALPRGAMAPRGAGPAEPSGSWQQRTGRREG